MKFLVNHRKKKIIRARKKIPNQKYIVNTQGEKGRIIHVVTLNSEPLEYDLKKYGPGAFKIFMSKPKLTFLKTIVIVGTKKKTKELTPPTQPKTITSSKETKQQKQVMEKQKKELNVDKIIKRDLDNLSSNTFLNEKIRSDVESNIGVPKYKSKPNYLNTPAKKYVASPSALKSIPYPEKTYYVQPIPQRNHDDNKDIKNHEIKPNTSNKIGENNNKMLCPECNKELDFKQENDFQSPKKCEFCGEFYCWDCFDNHSCNESQKCFYCKSRIENEMVILSDFCNETFCCKRCLVICWEDSENEKGCEHCKGEWNWYIDREEDEDESDEVNEDEDEGCEEDVYDDEDEYEDEDEDEEKTCINCQTDLNDFEDNEIITCDCEEYFCCKHCFNKYHENIKLYHDEYLLSE